MNTRKRKSVVCLICIGMAALAGITRLSAQSPTHTIARARPQIGAQVWIEPGQTAQEIDGWFAELERAHMPVARLFLMWTYLETAPSQWDFALYDAAFNAAEKHHVRVVATLTPNGPPLFRGGDGSQGRDILKTEKDRAAAMIYLQKVVGRYRSSPALDTWLLVNEPGQKPSPTPNAVAAFQGWATNRYKTVDLLNATWGTNFSDLAAVQPSGEERSWNHNRELDWRAFWQKFQTDQLRWLAEQVSLLDPAHPLHLNPAGITGNLADVSDDLPAWRGFLDTLGCSIHPSWHFGLFDRDRYDLAVSYTNDLVRGSIEPKPYWVTELQGGNNIYSGTVGMEPTPSDIAQWTWTSLGSGANRVIFWLLNARREGVEAGEWSMLDFAQKPSERMLTASKIAKVIDDHSDFFTESKPVVSPVTVVLSLQTLTFEEVYHREDDPSYGRKDDPARGSNAHFFEAMGFYQALSSLGATPGVKYFDDYDWAAVTPERRIAVLPDARVITAQQANSLKAFVDHGNLLLISGLTGFYGPHAEAWPLAGFPLGEITGGVLKEVHLRETTPIVSFDSGDRLPSRLWVSSITPGSAHAIAKEDGEVVATERTSPQGGSVVWIPSPVGIGAWFTGVGPLASFLQKQVLPKVKAPIFSFKDGQNRCLLKVLQHGISYVTVVANGDDQPRSCLMTTSSALHFSVLWGIAPENEDRQISLNLPARGTSVLLWH